ncbi:MAG: hypothetical protein OXE84_12170 [Rhodobacteraceae bacterium]|nr:hypothetical protein [Paracoccaceae bacterium]MCY4198044.1 hypothetical protein [Paracoccaceae bacterium]
MTPSFTIKAVSVRTREVCLRLPFQFGSTTVTKAPEAYVEVMVEGRNGIVHGYGAQMMIPRWFDKRTHLTNEDTVKELAAVISVTKLGAPGLAGSVRQLSTALRVLAQDGMPSDCPSLATGFGPALLEMALIDAACRSEKVSFAEAARKDLFGLAEDAPSDIPASDIRAALETICPEPRIALRHTIGYNAPLTRMEAGPSTDRDDQPVTVQEVVSATGIRAFKIKLKGDVESDIDRLKQLNKIFKPLGDIVVTLDANEQYEEESLNELVRHIQVDSELSLLRSSLLFLEQPFAREVALADRERPFDIGVPIMIDESDDCDDALPQAWALGWSGTSVKSCKGVLRALLNKARTIKRQGEGLHALLSAEDLTCQPGLCWQQDTMMATCIGATHVERNGHHFAGGMQGADDTERAAFLAAHPKLYRQTSSGIRLIILNGETDITSLTGPGFSSYPFGNCV